jgi:hypothetical protein
LVPISAAAHEEQDRHDDEDDHEDRSDDPDAKCCDHERASLFKSARTRTIGDALIMTLPSTLRREWPRRPLESAIERSPEQRKVGV